MEEARKLHLIEEILKIEKERTLEEIETVINNNSAHNPARRRSFTEFAGMITETEAKELKEIIEQGCEQINPDDWK